MSQNETISEPLDFNKARAKRAMSERRFYLGPYTFKRRPTVPPEVLSMYAIAGQDGDDADTIQRFERALLELVEDKACVTDTGEVIPTTQAWEFMRRTGDENDVVSFEDMASITEWLIAGVVERPTMPPSDSPGGSPSRATGTSSTGTSPTPVEHPSILLTPDGPSTPST